MSKILVPPTVLLAVSDQFARASDHLEMTKNTLNTQISMMMFTWDGTTRQRFFADFQRARSEMKLTIEHMRVISQELKDIAYKFLAVDSETGELDPRCMAPVIPASGSGVVDDGPKTWGDHAEELWKGVQSGAKILADSITGTAEALIEDPIGTGGQMAYDATIGTVEEVIDTAVWGTKMVFDVGDTREQFDEKWNAEQDKINQMGMSGYLGEKGALFLSNTDVY
ncbi:MAG: WXG100 family type VII secretion target [Bacillota bacterium]